MKIGILTFHHVDNYGAMLQAYALQRFLRDQGYDVETIDYRPIYAIRYYRRGISPISRSFKINSFSVQKIVKLLKMGGFLSKRLKLSKHRIYKSIQLKKLSSQYDVVVVGSDQVWCLDSFRFREADDYSFFLDFVSSNVPKVSYAASFGSTTDLGQHKRKICDLVNSFSTILVRDQNSLRIIEEECGKSAQKVLDPTFLIDYEDIMKPLRQNIKDYLLIYNKSEPNEHEKEFIAEIARSRELKIVSVGRFNRIAEVNFPTADPSDWLSLFKNASHIVTNTYHGTIFSLIFQKTFTVLYSPNKTNKTNDLLSSVNLLDRVLVDPREVYLSRVHLEAIDYSKVQKELTGRISDSKSALLASLLEQSTLVNQL